MWVQDLNEMCDFLRGSFPYYLLVFVPLLMIMSPVGAAHEFPVYRMHQYDLHGVPHGCRSAGINLEARSVRSWSTNRHCVLTSIFDLTPEIFHNIRTKAGALIVVLPKNMKKPLEELVALEHTMMAEPVAIPVYFAQWSETLHKIADEVSAQPSQVAGSAFEAAVSGVAANGYQLVISSTPPTPKDAAVTNLQGTLLGRGVPESLPTIAIVAHMDATGAASELSFGGDSNASGVAILIELARIFSNLYNNPRTHGRFNIMFLISGAGKLNYLGSKKYLEDQIDNLEGSLLQDSAFVLCLDSLGKNTTLHMHVSKPPRDGSYSGQFLQAGQIVSGDSIRMVHKKINLADEMLAWEHERYSIRRLPAFTMSALKSHRELSRSSIFDVADTLDMTALEQNAVVIAESLARVIYNNSEGGQLGGQLKVEAAALKSSLRMLAGTPRAANLLTGPAEKPAPPVAALKELLAKYLPDVKVSALLPDRRDPDFVLFDSTASILNVYSVKPAVFDLILTVGIVAYLGIVYLVLTTFPDLYYAISKLVINKKKIG